MTHTHKNSEFCNIPSGMGGSFPAFITHTDGAKTQVICLHPNYFTGQKFTFDSEKIEPLSTYAVTKEMRSIVSSHFNSKA